MLTPQVRRKPRGDGPSESGCRSNRGSWCPRHWPPTRTDQVKRRALLATDGTPLDKIAEPHATLNGAMSDPALRSRMIEGDVGIGTSASPADFVPFCLADRARWGGVVRSANIPSE